VHQGGIISTSKGCKLEGATGKFFLWLRPYVYVTIGGTHHAWVYDSDCNKKVACMKRGTIETCATLAAIKSRLRQRVSPRKHAGKARKPQRGKTMSRLEKGQRSAVSGTDRRTRSVGRFQAFSYINEKYFDTTTNAIAPR
jgi:hypothetical protein